jgi:hypothetical protein
MPAKRKTAVETQAALRRLFPALDQWERHDGYAAEGCIVLASPATLKQLLARRELARAVCIERRVEGEGPVCWRKAELLPL